MSSCPLNGILSRNRCNFAFRALQGPVKSILVQPYVSLAKRNLTHHPRKRIFSPGGHFERSESKINLVGIGPFCIPAICRSQIKHQRSKALQAKLSGTYLVRLPSRSSDVNVARDRPGTYLPRQARLKRDD